MYCLRSCTRVQWRNSGSIFQPIKRQKEEEGEIGCRVTVSVLTMSVHEFVGGAFEGSDVWICSELKVQISTIFLGVNIFLGVRSPLTV